MDDSTLKPRVNAYKGKNTYVDNATVLASMYPFYFDSSEVSNTDSIFSDGSDITSSDLSIFDSSSDASSITDSSVFIDCSI